MFPSHPHPSFSLCLGASNSQVTQLRLSLINKQTISTVVLHVHLPADVGDGKTLALHQVLGSLSSRRFCSFLEVLALFLSLIDLPAAALIPGVPVTIPNAPTLSGASLTVAFSPNNLVQGEARSQKC